jgi:hypothetical protein
VPKTPMTAVTTAAPISAIDSSENPLFVNAYAPPAPNSTTNSKTDHAQAIAVAAQLSRCGIEHPGVQSQALGEVLHLGEHVVHAPRRRALDLQHELLPRRLKILRGHRRRRRVRHRAQRY